MTEFGCMFYKDCIRILADIAIAEDALAPEKCNLSGIIRIAAPQAFMNTHLAEILSDFAKNHPKINLDVDSDDRLVNMNLSSYDIAIRLGPVPDSTFIAREITKNPTYLCASPLYLEKHGTPQHPSELEFHEGLIYTNRSPNSTWELYNSGNAELYKIKCRLRTDSTSLLLSAAKAGLGIMVTPLLIANAAILNGELKIVLPEYKIDGGSIVAMYRKTHRNSLKINTLVSFLIDALAD
jgi:DNA-binding transcriptional LysR family regulator